MALHSCVGFCCLCARALRLLRQWRTSVFAYAQVLAQGEASRIPVKRKKGLPLEIPMNGDECECFLFVCVIPPSTVFL